MTIWKRLWQRFVGSARLSSPQLLGRAETTTHGITIASGVVHGRVVYSIRLTAEQFATLERRLSWDDGWGPLFFAMREHGGLVGLDPSPGHRAHTDADHDFTPHEPEGASASGPSEGRAR